MVTVARPGFPSFIEVIDGAVDDEVCREILAGFDEEAVEPGRTAHGHAPEHKSSEDFTLSDRGRWASVYMQVVEAAHRGLVAYARRYPALVAAGLTVSALDPKTSRAVELTPERARSLTDVALLRALRLLYCVGEVRCQRYRRGMGHYHKWHHEQHPTKHDELLHLRRVLFFTLYLSDVIEGGETEFLHYGSYVRPVTGRLLIAPGGFTHAHRGNTPLSGDKHIVTSWFLYRDAATLFP